ncbi:MAG: ZIP family metal transporter [Nitrososphaeria archaeon]|nr:ZIP family metal transporter [Nitrososphaeria archaeon]NIQ32188.1 ZIP family metal transporter [Nitrososphaeria archaeon]
MNVLAWIIGTTFAISLIAFLGALILFLKKELLDKLLLILVAFSAGSLIGGAFLHLIPEAILKVGVEEALILNTFLYLLLGFCIFFILEQLIRWHHHHATAHPNIMPFSYLILISDGVHNFIDGLVIAASFIISFPVGVVTALAIALHEIPQEIGDFGVLVYGGFRKSKALVMNYISAITLIFGGISGYLLSAWIGESIVFLMPFAAGNFIYISSVDLIPEIGCKESVKISLLRFCIFLTGLLLMLAIKLF